MGDSKHSSDRLYRLVKIHQLLLRDTPELTAGMLAERFGVNTRTVRRDLSYLRERLGAPIDFDSHQRRYRYVGPFHLLPELMLSEDEVLILAALRELHLELAQVRRLMERLMIDLEVPTRERVEEWKKRLAP